MSNKDGENELLTSLKSTFAESIKAVGWLVVADALIEAIKTVQPHLDEAWARDIEHMRSGNSGPFKTPTANQLAPVLLMLGGFAMENIFKARIADLTDWTRLNQEESLPTAFIEHDLLKLAEKAGIEVRREDQDTLRRMSAAATWWGRYPSPTNFRKFLEKIPIERGGVVESTWWSPRAHHSRMAEEVVKIVERYRANLAESGAT